MPEEPAAEPEPETRSPRVCPIPLSCVLGLSFRLQPLAGVQPLARIARAHATGTLLHVVVAAGLPADAEVFAGAGKSRCWVVCSPGSLRVFTRFRAASEVFWEAPLPAYILGQASLAEAYSVLAGAARIPARSRALGDVGDDGAETIWHTGSVHSTSSGSRSATRSRTY